MHRVQCDGAINNFANEWNLALTATHLCERPSMSQARQVKAQCERTKDLAEILLSYEKQSKVVGLLELAVASELSSLRRFVEYAVEQQPNFEMS